MNEEQEMTLTKVFCDVLGKYALMFGDEVKAAETELKEGGYVYASINFDGGKKGMMEITAGKDFSAMLNMNILGDFEGAGAAGDESHDSFKEFLNIMCGEYLTVVYGKKMLFNLDPPEARLITEAEAEALKGKVRSVYIVEDTPVIVYALTEG